MKVTKIEVFHVHKRKSTGQRPIIIKVDTDEGISGLGEVGLAYGAAGHAGAAVIKDLAQYVLGRDPFDTERVWNDFLKEISEGTFEDLQLSEIYDGIAVHLYVTMEDGTVNPFRISCDGYVLYDGLPWYGVKISDDTLQAVLEACGV